LAGHPFETVSNATDAALITTHPRPSLLPGDENKFSPGPSAPQSFPMTPAKTPELVFFPSNLSPSVRRTISGCLEFGLELSD
jgi:hypothetical protein